MPLSSKSAAFLFLRRPEELKTDEQEILRTLQQFDPEIEQAYRLVQQFAQMLRTRTGERLDAWLESARASQIREIQSFIQGIERDKAAVVAGLTLSQNNGPLEGNVNRLKLLKRSMYGRAEFDLLKFRVLYRSKQSQDRKDKKKNYQEQQVDRLKKLVNAPKPEPGPLLVI